MLTKEQLLEAAEKYNLPVSTIHAVIEVESGGSGFLEDGRPKILFEGHIFWRELKKVGLNSQKLMPGNEDIIYMNWTKDHYIGGAGEYTRLDKAIKIHREAALKSASWGLFQIMGENYALTGDQDIETFVKEEYASEMNQLYDFLNFITNTRLIKYLRVKNWAKFAAGYNGPGYKANKYDIRLQAADAKYV
jgi:hypothetical protein